MPIASITSRMVFVLAGIIGNAVFFTNGLEIFHGSNISFKLSTMRHKQLHKASGPLQVDHALEWLDVRLQNRKQIWRIFKPPFEWFPIHFCGIRCGCV
jgi:hypothetical protein